MKTFIKDEKIIGWNTPLPITGQERLRVWEKAQNVWEKRTNVDKELKKLRNSWDRKLPKLK